MTARTVWVAAYPKSGNTWLRAVCTAWASDGPIDINALVGAPIASSRSAFDAALGVPSSSLTAAEIELARPLVDDVLAAEATEPHLRKIHDAYFVGPAGEPIVSLAATRAAVYVVRDPREVAVSYAHQANIPFECARRRLNDPDAAICGSRSRLHEQLRQRLGTWSSHVRSWVDATPFPVEVVRYEDFAAAPVAAFGRALRFAGYEGVDDSRIEEAVERAAFDRLRGAERESGFRERPPGAPAFFRRGESGSWREELPYDVAEGIREDHGEVMARFGYD